MRINQKVCFIAGTGHSGSTLLGLLLGNHSQGFYCGEGKKSRFLSRDNAPLQKRSCKFCGLDCPVWGNFTPTPDLDLYEQITQQIHRTLNITSSLVIDSSSSADWIQTQCESLAQTEAQPHLIFLKRDGRGVVNSYRRKYGDRPLEQIIENWITNIQKAQALFEVFPGPKTILHYEDLATNTDRALQNLCDFLSIPYEPEMRNFSQKTYHLLGGNNGTQFLATGHQSNELLQVMTPSNRQYYQTHKSDIILDVRWQQELSPEHLQLFAHLAGELNQSFEWHP